MDGSDEDDCGGKKCAVVQCHNGRCLDDFAYQCDGTDDCGDNSDEFHCGKNCLLVHSSPLKLNSPLSLSLHLQIKPAP